MYMRMNDRAVQYGIYEMSIGTPLEKQDWRRDHGLRRSSSSVLNNNTLMEGRKLGHGWTHVCSMLTKVTRTISPVSQAKYMYAIN